MERITFTSEQEERILYHYINRRLLAETERKLQHYGEDEHHRGYLLGMKKVLSILEMDETIIKLEDLDEMYVKSC